MPLISSYASDATISGLDKLLGTDSVTGKTKSYLLQSVFDSVTVSASSIFLTRVLTIEEEAGKDFVQVINEDVTGFTLQTGEVAFFVVNDLTSTYKATYVMIRPVVTTAVTYGFSETQVVLSDFLLLREPTPAVGEANTISSAGGSVSLAGVKAGVDLPIKGISAGAGISIVDGGTFATISSSITQAEINTLGDLGDGTVKLTGTKSGSELKIKSIDVKGAVISSDANKVTIDVWDRLTITTSQTLDSTYNRRTVFLDNGLNDITITIPVSLAADFQAAFIQLGTGNVTFAVSSTTLLTSETKIEGQYKQVWLEKSPVGSENFLLLGNTKA